MIYILLFLFAFTGSVVSENEKDSLAEVTTVKANGTSGKYRLSVTIKSPDTGCDQYANWWEVLSESEELLYRRILHHSHVNEQPFTRSGGPVEIDENEIVIVRVHMNNSGYSSLGMKGSVSKGFESITLDDHFATQVESLSPQPGTCAF